jgi:hypothetical protein
MTDHDLKAYSETNRIMRHSANDDTGKLANRVFDADQQGYGHRKPGKVLNFCKPGLYTSGLCIEFATGQDGYCDACRAMEAEGRRHLLHGGLDGLAQAPRHASGRRETTGAAEMIWNPQPGQHVRLHYGPKWRKICRRWHGREGVVVTAIGKGGPGNVQVLIEGDGPVFVPRGNLVAIGAAK